LKTKLVVFFLHSSTAYWGLKIALKRQKRKGTPANTLAKQGFEDRNSPRR
jgi:hypothetical protein